MYLRVSLRSRIILLASRIKNLFMTIMKKNKFVFYLDYLGVETRSRDFLAVNIRFIRTYKSYLVESRVNFIVFNNFS